MNGTCRRIPQSLIVGHHHASRRWSKPCDFQEHILLANVDSRPARNKFEPAFSDIAQTEFLRKKLRQRLSVRCLKGAKQRWCQLRKATMPATYTPRLLRVAGNCFTFILTRPVRKAYPGAVIKNARLRQTVLEFRVDKDGLYMTGPQSLAAIATGD